MLVMGNKSVEFTMSIDQDKGWCPGSYNHDNY